MTAQLLNELEDAGIISSHCVTWDDVASVDKERALKWIKMGEDLI